MVYIKNPTVTPKRSINSRRKGVRNERKAIKPLATWTGLEFSRTPSSGGLRWKRTNDVVGDVVCTSKSGSLKFPISIEIKAHKDIILNNLIGESKVTIIEFWEQAVRDSIRADKMPLLLMRKDRMPMEVYYAVIPLRYYQEFERYKELTLLDNPRGLGLFNSKGHSIAIMDSRDLFKTNYKEVRKIIRRIIHDGHE
jgi:hypothetical protein